MKHVKVRSMVFDVPEMAIACDREGNVTEHIPGASKAIVSMGLREDGKLFCISSTLRADRLHSWEYVKYRQENTQLSWDHMRDDPTDTESLNEDQFNEEFNRQLSENHAVEIPAYVL